MSGVNKQQLPLTFNFHSSYIGLTLRWMKTNVCLSFSSENSVKTWTTECALKELFFSCLHGAVMEFISLQQRNLPVLLLISAAFVSIVLQLFVDCEVIQRQTCLHWQISSFLVTLRMWTVFYERLLEVNRRAGWTGHTWSQHFLYIGTRSKRLKSHQVQNLQYCSWEKHGNKQQKEAIKASGGGRRRAGDVI